MNENKLAKLEAATVYGERSKRRVKDFNHLNTLAKKGQIVFIGDSIIEFWPTGELFAGLKEKTGLEVYNRGIDGDTSNRMLERIEANVCSVAPKALYILIGTNDFIVKFPTEYTIENIKKTIEAVKLHCPDCTVFIQSLLPVNKELDKAMVSSRKNKKIIAFNDELRRLVLNLGCIYVDVFEQMLDETDNFSAEYSYDGLHPSVTGYIRLSEIITPLIAAKAAPPAPAAEAPLTISEISGDPPAEG